jgi:uncharacterized membrane protein YadS
MVARNIAFPQSPAGENSAKGSGFWHHEDWLAVFFGLGIVAVAYGLFASGSSLAWLAVIPAKWNTSDQLVAHFAGNWVRYLAQFIVWLAIVGTALRSLGLSVRDILPAFALVYVASIVIFAIGQWSSAVTYNLEPPLIALVFGLAIANLGILPRRLDAGFRVEFYVKLGIILLGATLPFTLIVWGGPVALLQASIVSVVTFLVIFWVGRLLGLNPRFAAVLGAGGAICGVSAAIAISGAVGARKQDAPVAIAIVIIWAIVTLLALPFAAAALNLPAGVGGAWIGTSEFADAAGIAAAQTYGDIAAHVPGAPAGAADQAVTAYTLIKVIGRDTWIGIWAVVLSIIAVTRWNDGPVTNKASLSEIWRRFPKFVLGFIIASAFITAVTVAVGHAAVNASVTPDLITPIKNLRIWAFTFTFLSIGLTTRFRELAGFGFRPFAAFTAGVAVNLVIGFVLSTIVFASYWAGLGK